MSGGSLWLCGCFQELKGGVFVNSAAGAACTTQNEDRPHEPRSEQEEDTDPHLGEAPMWGCRCDWEGSDFRALDKITTTSGQISGSVWRTGWWSP